MVVRDVAIRWGKQSNITSLLDSVDKHGSIALFSRKMNRRYRFYGACYRAWPTGLRSG